VAFLKRSLLFVFLLCLGCSAQSNTSAELSQRIDRQVRAFYQLPAGVQVNIGERKPSKEFAGFDEVTLTFSMGARKQTQQFLLSQDGKTLVRITKLDLSKDPYAEVMNKIDAKGLPFRGNPNAKVTIVNYDDFQCPFCSRMHQTLNEIMKTYGDRVKLVYKDFPLYQIHVWANHAAVDSHCLADQSNDAFWGFADYVHAHGADISGQQRPVAEQFAALDTAAIEQAKKFNLDSGKVQACMQKQDDSKVKASADEATALGVDATPTMFVNGAKLDGAVPAEEVKAVIDRALRDAGVQPAVAAAAVTK
jgi:protein-disulfide isomerase